MMQAAEYCRARKGPALVHAHVIRPYSHSLSDDEVQYRTAAEREADAERDPLVTCPRYLLEQGIATEAELELIRQQVEEEVAGRGRGGARVAAAGHRHDLRLRLLARRRSHVGAVRHRGRSALHRRADHDGGPAQRLPARRDGARSAHPGLRRGRGRRQPRGVPRRGEGQGRRLQGDLGAAASSSAATGSTTRRWPRPTSSAGPSGWPRAGSSRSSRSSSSTTSGRRTCSSATSSRSCAGARTTPSAAPVVVRVTYGGYLKGGAVVSLADRRGGVHRRSRASGRLPRHRARRERAAAHRDPLRGSGALPRAQAPLPPDLQQGAESRARTS